MHTPSGNRLRRRAVLAVFVVALSAGPALAQRLLGIDVSGWQYTIDWHAVKASGRDFAFVRASTGGWYDPTCRPNMLGAREAGVVAGCYHFARPAESSPETQASQFVGYAAEFMVGGTLRPVIDVEWGGGQTPVGAANLTEWVTVWMDSVQSQTGVEPIIYCNNNYIRNYLNASLAQRTLWLARWTHPSDPLTENPPDGITGFFPTWTFWQYSDAGNGPTDAAVPGITVPVDLDVFNGTMEELQTYTIPYDLPPIAYTVEISDRAEDGVVITWKTNQPSTTQVEYGLTTAYGSSCPLDPAETLEHRVQLTGLAAGTTYHYRLITGNATGNAPSPDRTFITWGAPLIQQVRVSSIGTTTATVSWSTESAGTTQLIYGSTATYGQQTPLDAELSLDHSVTLTGLTPDRQYHCQALSTNSNAAAHSSDVTFRTAGAPVISEVMADNVSYKSAEISWRTDQPADSQVDYGPTIAYGMTSAPELPQSTWHSVMLSDLTVDTEYHYRVRSSNAGGVRFSSDYTFTTGPIPQEYMVDNADRGCGGTGAWTSVSASVAKIGADCLFTSPSGSPTSATASFRWVPEFLRAGTYEVYAYFQAGPDRNTAVTYTVSFSGGTLTSVQNQYSPSAQGKWVKLTAAPIAFAAGVAGYVEVGNNTASPGYVSADAMRFVRIDTQPPTVPLYMTAVSESSSTIRLNWVPSTDDTAVTGYKLYRDGVCLGTLTVTFYTNVGLAANTGYRYEVSAIDAMLHESARSPVVTRATLPVAPGPASVTADVSRPCGVTWSAAGAFGPGTVQYYGYAWNQAPTYAFSGAEPRWTGGPLRTAATSGGTWYLHLRAYNVDDAAGGTFSYPVADSPHLMGDFDGDCDVDAGDLETLLTCKSGVDEPAADGCGLEDLDGDSDVDQEDYGRLQRCYAGPGDTPDPSCTH
jgi:GH25 family lysozyme M1 (1,4-beta-N-acetylmuramidase)